MVVMVWVQIGFPVVDLHGGAAAGRPGALRGGRDRRRRLVAAVPARSRCRRSGRRSSSCALTCTIAALKVFGPIYVLTRGGPENATNVPSYFAYFTFFEKLAGRLRPAIATVLTLIIVVVSRRLHPAAASQRATDGRLSDRDDPVRRGPLRRPAPQHPRPAPPRCRRWVVLARSSLARCSCWCRSSSSLLNAFKSPGRVLRRTAR